MRRILKVLAAGLVDVLLPAALVLLIARPTSPLPDERITPGGLRPSSSTYVSMRDGVEIAVSVLLPTD
jgi:hypothetical protein